MYVLGIDPGYAICGWGVVATATGQVQQQVRAQYVASGVLRTKPGGEVQARVDAVVARCLALVGAYNAAIVALEGFERLPYGRVARSTLDMGRLIGGLHSALREKFVAVLEVSPREVKRALTGRCAGSKEAVAAGVALLLGTRVLKDHETDALAVALTALARRRP